MRAAGGLCMVFADMLDVNVIGESETELALSVEVTSPVGHPDGETCRPGCL
jgi:hypothetical protein